MEITRTMLESGLFEGITEEELVLLLGCLGARAVDFSRNDLIAYAGQSQKYIGLVLEGKLSMVKENLQGQRMLLMVLKPGDSFGEMNAYSGSRIWPATVTAESRGSIIALPLDRIAGNCEKRCFSHWALVMNLLKLVSKKALALNKALDYMGIKGIERKVAAMLLERMRMSGVATFDLGLSRAQMADNFFVTRPALSRVLGIMRNSGAIDYEGAVFMVKDAASLERTLESDVP